MSQEPDGEELNVPDDLSGLTAPPVAMRFLNAEPDAAVIAYLDQTLRQMIDLQGRLTALMVSVYAPEMEIDQATDTDEIARREQVANESSFLVLSLDHGRAVTLINVLLNRIAQMTYEAARAGWNNEGVPQALADITGVTVDELTEAVGRWKAHRAALGDRPGAAPDHLDPS